jgi:hypothetical protein
VHIYLYIFPLIYLKTEIQFLIKKREH